MLGSNPSASTQTALQDVFALPSRIDHLSEMWGALCSLYTGALLSSMVFGESTSLCIPLHGCALQSTKLSPNAKNHEKLVGVRCQRINPLPYEILVNNVPDNLIRNQPVWKYLNDPFKLVPWGN